MLKDDMVQRAVDWALAEDLPQGDLTTDLILPPEHRSKAVLVARESGILAGMDVFDCVFNTLDPSLTVGKFFEDGAEFKVGDILAELKGPSHTILAGERTALNFVQRMSGIASLTRQFVLRVEGSGVQILDTRKTTPGIRFLEKHAVACGGGTNHRSSLSDAILIKDNHLSLVQDGRESLSSRLQQIRTKIGPHEQIEVEVDMLEQIPPLLEANVDIIMLDEFSNDDMREAVKLINGRALVEASGGVTLDRVGSIAETGVDYISVGALTHSYRSIDLGLDMIPVFTS